MPANDTYYVDEDLRYGISNTDRNCLVMTGEAEDERYPAIQAYLMYGLLEETDAPVFYVYLVKLTTSKAKPDEMERRTNALLRALYQTSGPFFFTEGDNLTLKRIANIGTDKKPKLLVVETNKRLQRISA